MLRFFFAAMLGTVTAAPCTFSDSGPGVTLISELGLPAFEAAQVRTHVLANSLVPAQETGGGQTTVLFDTPTKDIDPSMEVRVQTQGSTSEPITGVSTASSQCVPYTPNLCFRKIVDIVGAADVQYETTWSGTCLGGKRDVRVTACLNAENRNFSHPGTPVGGIFQCTVSDPIENGPKVRLESEGCHPGLHASGSLRITDTRHLFVRFRLVSPQATSPCTHRPVQASPPSKDP